MYKIIQLLQPARRVYDTYDGPSLSGLLTNWNNMSDWQLYYTYCTDCWLETGGETLCIPFLLYSSWSHLLPCFLCSLVSCLSSCLFRQGGWGQQQRRIKALSLNARQRQSFFHLRLGTLPPLLCRICNKCPPHRLHDDRNPETPLGLPSGQEGFVAMETWEYCQERKIVQKKIESKYQLSRRIRLFVSPPQHLTIHFSLPFALNWTHTF